VNRLEHRAPFVRATFSFTVASRASCRSLPRQHVVQRSPEQRFLYAADYGNSHIAVLDRKSMQVLYQFGTRSAEPGNFQGPHLIATDSKGNLYVAEVAPGNRAQKFLLKGMSQTPPPNALTPAQLSATR